MIFAGQVFQKSLHDDIIFIVSIMVMTKMGRELIFMISQPRAGSTLTQRILGGHPDIHTQSEPWVMLHPMHVFKPDSIHSVFDSNLYTLALNNFINQLPGGKSEYIQSITGAYAYLYNKILSKNGKKLFLDKTPRYYHIISELYEYFPNAKFVFLFRNPAAIISSIVKSWIGSDWYRLAEFKEDLLNAPQLMLDGVELLKEKAFVIFYEELVSKPVQQVSALCDYLGISFDESIIDYGQSGLERWHFGDQKTVYTLDRPDVNYMNAWEEQLNHPQVWRIVREYLDILGADVIRKMGYSYPELDILLEKNKPNVNINEYSLPFSSLLDNTRSPHVEIRKLNSQLNNLLNNLKDKDEQLKGMKTMLIQTEEKLQSNADNHQKINTKITQLSESLSQKDQEISHKEKEVDSLRMQIDQTNILLAEKSDRINTLENSNKETLKAIQSNTKISQEIQSCKRLIEENATLTHQQIQSIINQSVQINYLMTELKAKNNELENLKNDLESEKLKLNESDDLLKRVSKSYTFRIGKIITFPLKLILGRLKAKS